MYASRQLKRLARGSAISEFPPALFLLLFFALFPALNLIFLGLTFSSCVVLNNLELREAARTPNAQLSGVFDSLQQNWLSSGIGQFAGITTAPQATATYSKIGTDTYVTVATTFSVKSFLAIPYFKNVPWLGAPLTYTVSGKRILEHPNYAPPSS